MFLLAARMRVRFSERARNRVARVGREFGAWGCCFVTQVMMSAAMHASSLGSHLFLYWQHSCMCASQSARAIDLRVQGVNLARGGVVSLRSQCARGDAPSESWRLYIF